MEDAHRIIEGFNNDPSAGFFAVYDGHGGREVVDIVKAKLDTNLAQAINNRGGRSIESTIIAAYAKTDAQCCSCNSSGSTAATALVINEGLRRMLYVANVGDTRVVLCEGSRARRLSFDHKAADPGEMQRVSEAGGFVMMGRVMGVLAVARSLGDNSLKPFVSAEPHVTSVELGNSNRHPFLIVACDGVWDVLSDQEAVERVLACRQAQQHKAAELIVRAALDKGSRDNITCMVIYLVG
jgi:serine/threonine protein phosphatase PrpC